VKPNSHHGQAMIAYGANHARMIPAWAAASIVAAVTIGSMRLQSSDVAAGHAFPKAFMARECGGENRSPELAWSGAPAGTKSFAVVMHDADAPVQGGFYHWIAYDLSSATHRLAAGATLTANVLGKTTANTVGYWGPCPPQGPAHHYTITVYALDVAGLSFDAPPPGAQLERRIAGHVLARATLQATASR
jgi:Raf kinase inhibitor-like YbhB/YbcL family protein